MGPKGRSQVTSSTPLQSEQDAPLSLSALGLAHLKLPMPMKHPTSRITMAYDCISAFTRRRDLYLLSLALLLLSATPSFGSSPQRLTSHPAADYQPTVSANAQFLAFVSTRSGNEDIWVQSLSKTALALPRQITTHPASDHNPSINRDGTRLLYVSHKTDPRGDIYLRDLITGEEQQLTDLRSGDTFPQWDPEENAFYYLKTPPLEGTSAIYRKTFSDNQEALIVPHATSFSVGTTGAIVYTDHNHVTIMDIHSKHTTALDSASPALDLWPSILPPESSATSDPFIFFTRYEQDTNGDGQLDTDDESSLWMYSVPAGPDNKTLDYQLTPAHQFHAYPTTAGTFLYYADLKRGDLFRIDIPAFLNDYADLDQAKALATSYQDTGRSDQALLVLTNISRNLLGTLSPEAQADFDFSLAEAYVREHNFASARQVIQRHHTEPGRIGVLASIYDITLGLQERALTVSAAERNRLITTATKELLDLANQHQAQEEIYGHAYIAAGRLHLFANHPLKALDYLIKVENLRNKDVRAQALFSRAEAYQALGDRTNVLKVFIDVIHVFGEDSSWGRRAILRALDLSQQNQTPQEAITALNSFMAQQADLPVLSATARLRVATFYDALGEQGPALESLESVLTATNVPRDLTIQAFQHKARLLSAAERFQEAADTYAALGQFTGEGHGQLKDTQELLVLQLVKKALKDRKIGETRIAAKSLKHLIDQYPQSVEAHRAYIETKSMLKDTQELQSWYSTLVKAEPQNAVYRYGQALAYSYAEPPNLPRVLKGLSKAVDVDPSIAYIHQTLGWAYEQTERVTGQSGNLEKAEREYRLALDLNDRARLPEVESQLLLNLGNTYLALGNFREAYRHYRQREDQFTPTGDSSTEMLYRKNYGEACFKSGRSQEAVGQYQLALRRVPSDQPAFKAQLLERLGLAYQDLGEHAQAIDTYTKALDINRELGNTQNVALLQRNIGVNLFNLSETDQPGSRADLKRALDSYFTSLEHLTRMGGNTIEAGAGLINLEVGLSETASQAASGFDKRGEEKLMFSYIANTYERLAEPGPAKDYFEKKLALLNQAASDPPSAAALTEKAIVLNRIGVLSHQMGRPLQAVESLRQSLNYTRTLNIPFGTSVNLYNLSKLAVEEIEEGRLPEESLFELLTEGLEGLHSMGYEDPTLFYTLTNTALLLSRRPETPQHGTATMEESVQRIHRQFRYDTLPWSYYTRAESLLQKPSLFPDDQRAPLTFLVKLNQAELAKNALPSTTVDHVQDDLQSLVNDHKGSHAWLWYLLQAETTQDASRRQEFLTHAVDTVLQFPAQTDSLAGISGLWPAYDRLIQLSVDNLVAEGKSASAFAISEQLSLRQRTSAVYDMLGEDFFLKGLGDYGPELQSLFAEIRQARLKGDEESLEQLSPFLEELLYILYEEQPWAAAAFWSYPLSNELIFLAVDRRHPYVKILQGQQGYHGFVHNGERLHYSPITLKDGKMVGDQEFHQRLNQAASAYVSVASELEPALLALPLGTTPITRVSSAYDFMTGFHLRSLFFSHLTAPENFQPRLEQGGGEIPFSLEPFTGKPDHDRALAASSNIAAFLHAPDRVRFEVDQTQNVRESVSVVDFAGTQHHSLILFGGLDPDRPSPDVAIAAFLQAGFPHIIVSQHPVNSEEAATWLNRYLLHLQRLPPDEAVVAASQDLWGAKAGFTAFHHYGFAGMAADEREEYATLIYDQEQAKAITAFEEQRFSDSLTHIEHTLALMDYAGKQGEFKPLTTLAVETAFEIGNYEKGLFFQQKLLKALTPETSTNDRAEVLYRLGILYSRMERFDEAVQQLEEATRLWNESGELDRLAEGVATLGVVRENMGSYSEALEKFHESFSLYEEIGEMGQTAFQYRRMGRIHYLRLGRYEKAREHFLVALDRYQQQGDRRGEAEVLYEVGLTFEKVALFDQAANYYTQGLTIGQELQQPFLMATGHLYLANLAWFQGEYQTAFQRLTQADQQAALTNDAQLRIMVKNTRGLMYWTLNEPEKGLHHLHEAVKLSEASNIQTELASSLNNLGLIYRQQGDHTTALEKFTRAKELDESLKSLWGLGYDHRNIGISLLALGKLKEAEAQFLKAEQISADIHNVTNWVKALLELGNLNHALHQPEQALEYYQRTFDLAKKHGIQEVEWRAAAGMGTVLREKHQTTESLSWLSTAVEVVEGMRASLKIDELRNSFQRNKLDLYRDIITLLIGMNRTDDAFNYLERSRSRSFIDLLGNQKMSFKNEADQDTWTHIHTLGSTLDSLRSELGSYDQPPTDLQQRYQRLKAQYEEAILEVKQQNPSLSSFIAVDPLNLKGVQDLLAPKVGLVSYFMTHDQTYLWFITRQQTLFKQVAVGEQELLTLISRYRQLVQHLEPVDEELQQLYGWLIKPFESEISNLEVLGIIPDGPLHFLSFAALKHGPVYLVDDIPLFYAPSASVFQFTFAKRQTTKNDKVLAIGNPDLGNYNYELPLAELEAQSMKWNYPQMDILTGAKATKEWVIENISKYGIIHLAAHGEFDEFNPLLSSLWLSSPNPENRRLTVKEVFGLELHADLVTLSACQTGLGKLEAGELIGLNRAFIYAGTHALVSALWRVDDLSTSVLMKHFYRNYVTLNKAKSLRQAQLIVKKDFPHPSYWAGFTLIGDYQ
ncbi:MAG: CHAT domain-containing protein [Nitrospirales bacterium]